MYIFWLVSSPFWRYGGTKKNSRNIVYGASWHKIRLSQLKVKLVNAICRRRKPLEMLVGDVWRVKQLLQMMLPSRPPPILFIQLIVILSQKWKATLSCIFSWQRQMSPGSCRFIVGNDTLEGQLMNSRLPRRIKLPAQTFLSLPPFLQTCS